MTTCRHCQTDKEASEFYASNRSKCKQCVRVTVTLRRRTNPDVQAYDRMRAKRPEVKARIGATAAKWRRDHPEKYRAETAVNNAIRDGRLVRKPCEECGNPKSHAHHDDYSKPLEVRFLCALHHRRWHAENG